MMTSSRLPGTTAMMLLILIGPSGVRACHRDSRTSSPAFLSSPVMYSRACARAEEPAGRGPNPTSRSTSRRAAAPSNRSPPAAARRAARAPPPAERFGVGAFGDPVENAGREAAVRVRQRYRAEILVLHADGSARARDARHLGDDRLGRVHVEEHGHGERDVEPPVPERQPAAVADAKVDAPAQTVTAREPPRGAYERLARIDGNDTAAGTDHAGQVA